MERINKFISNSIDILEASVVGFSMMIIDEKKKMAKNYKIEKMKESFNVSLIIENTNKLSGIEIYKIDLNDNVSEITKLKDPSKELVEKIEKDLKKIIVN
tara:strand:+ start:426 stop:725 length:300 start_codon:yes stop_codon:yes gene_type:complete